MIVDVRSVKYADKSGRKGFDSGKNVSGIKCKAESVKSPKLALDQAGLHVRLQAPAHHLAARQVDDRS